MLGIDRVHLRSRCRRRRTCSNLLAASASVEVHERRARDDAARPRARARRGDGAERAEPGARCRAGRGAKAPPARASSTCTPATSRCIRATRNRGAHHRLDGTAELVLEGRDMAAIAQLAGRIDTMTMARVGYALSRETRERSRPTWPRRPSRAIARKAAELREAVRLSTATRCARSTCRPASRPVIVPMRWRARMAMQAADESLPVEPGKATVTVTVNGSVQMTR